MHSRTRGNKKQKQKNNISLSDVAKNALKEMNR